MSSGGVLSITNAFDAEVKSSYVVRVKFVDTVPNELLQNFTITVNDVNDPTDITFDSTSVNENTPGAVG